MTNKTFHAQMARILQGKELNEEKCKNVFLIQCTFAMFNLDFSFLKMNLPSLGNLGIFFLITILSLSCIKIPFLLGFGCFGFFLPKECMLL